MLLQRQRFLTSNVAHKRYLCFIATSKQGCWDGNQKPKEHSKNFTFGTEGVILPRGMIGHYHY